MPWRALILFMSLLAASGPATAGEIAHTVKAGENPAALAKRYHVSVAAILARNQGVDPRRIKIGDVLVIPDAAAGPAPSVVVPAAGPTVAPAAGPTAAPDVASDVAPNAASDVAPDAGQGASAGPAPKAAAPGSADTPQDAAPAPKAAAPKPQPAAPPPPRAQPGASAKAAPSSAVLPDEEAPGRRYVVVPGDCPADIAERFGIPLDVLWRANPGLDPKRLPVGCVLTVPEGAAGAPPAVAVTRPGDPGSNAPLVMDFQ